MGNIVDVEHFLTWLDQRWEKLEEQLQPYYKELTEREASFQNAYGCATPRDNVNLAEQVAITTLKRRIANGESLEKVQADLSQDIPRNDPRYGQKSVLNEYIESLSISRKIGG